MSQADCKVMITKTVTSVRKVKLSPSVFLAHAKALENGTAKYPIRRVVCKTFTVPQGFRDISHEKLFSGQLPTRVVVGLVTNEAFNFQHKTDGTELCSHYIRGYNTLFSGRGLPEKSAETKHSYRSKRLR